MGERSLELKAIEYYEYVPMLIRVEQVCENWGYDFFEYINKFYNEAHPDISEEKF